MPEPHVHGCAAPRLPLHLLAPSPNPALTLFMHASTPSSRRQPKSCWNCATMRCSSGSGCAASTASAAATTSRECSVARSSSTSCPTSGTTSAAVWHRGAGRRSGGRAGREECSVQQRPHATRLQSADTAPPRRHTPGTVPQAELGASPARARWAGALPCCPARAAARAACRAGPAAPPAPPPSSPGWRARRWGSPGASALARAPGPS